MSHAYGTAMSRKDLSAPVKALKKRGLLLPGDRVLDYGCGRGGDADRLGIPGYDPHWRPDTAWEPGTFNIVLCSYVLNVVDETTQEEILQDILAALAPGGKAYLTVRRDLPREGTSGRGCFQRYVVLDLPLLLENSSFAIYVMHAAVAEWKTRGV